MHPHRSRRSSRNAGLLGCLLMLAGPPTAQPAPGATVAEDWAVLHNGPGNHSDQGYRVAADPVGNVYVAGTAYNPAIFRDELLLLKLDPAGGLVWEKTYDVRPWLNGPTDLAIGRDGHPVVSSATSAPGSWKLSLWKFDAADGSVLWDRHHPEAGGCWSGGAALVPLALDSSAHVYAAGCGIRLFKYAPDGALVWQRVGAPAALDVSTDLAVRDDGAVLLGGTNSANINSIGVAVYGEGGDVQWTATDRGPINSIFGATLVDSGPDGETVLAGHVESTCGVSALVVVRYNADGAFGWKRQYPDNPCTSFAPVGLHVAATGDVYVGGSQGGSADIALVKYDAAGQRQWVRTYDGPAHSTDVAFAMTADELDNIYLVGEEMFQPPQNRDIVTLKYTPGGVRAWAISFAGPSGGNDRPLGVGLGPCRQVYVTGYGWHPPFNDDVYVLAYEQHFAGDLDGDGDVDLRDFANFQSAFDRPVDPPPPNADLDGDDDVDLQDYLLLSAELAVPCQ